MEIHGQNEHIRLVRSDEQFRLLDGAAHARRPRLKRFRSSHLEWDRLEREKAIPLLSESPLDAGDADLLQYQLRELESNLLSAELFTELE